MSAALCVLILSAAVPAGAAICTPDSFGARHDGVTDDTAAIRKALGHCPAGTVQLKSGSYLSGPLDLSSGQTLEIARGATLLAKTGLDTYENGRGRPRALINAHDVHDITLTGEGTIDGQGEAWWPAIRSAKAQGKPLPPRPWLIVLTDVVNVHVSNLTLRNSPAFHLVPERARHVIIDGLTILAPADSPNTDGIDPSGHDILIRNTRIDVGDDNVAIKSGHADPWGERAASSRIVIRDCTFLHGHGLSIGSETNGGVTDVVADNITFEGTTTGLRIKTARDRGGEVSKVVYRNIRMREVDQAVLITAYYPKIPDEDAAQPIRALTPDIHDVTIENLSVDSAHKAGALIGLPERGLRNVRLVNIDIHAQTGLMVRYAGASYSGRLQIADGPATILQQGGVLGGGAAEAPAPPPPAPPPAP